MEDVCYIQATVWKTSGKLFHPNRRLRFKKLAMPGGSAEAAAPRRFSHTPVINTASGGIRHIIVTHAPCNRCFAFDTMF
jgi:hypothetical protein